MKSNQESTMKKFLKQVGNIVAVQAAAGAATELGKAVLPKLKEKVKSLLDKADELNKAKETRKDLSNLVKNSASYYKKAKESKKPDDEVTQAPPPGKETPADDPSADPPVDAKFTS